VASPERIAVALLSLARTDRHAAAQLLAPLSREEMGHVTFWLVMALTERCGWSDETLREYLLRQEASA
jgi:hypothetical protein